MPNHPTDPFSGLRAREFSRLAASNQAYLDYTGSALYPESLVRRHAERLHGAVLGNPHSENPASLASTAAVDATRAAVLAFFDADPTDYTVCFTANASGAIRLVGESFPFQPGSLCALSADNHNSVNGIREYAARAGADVRYLPLDPDLRLAGPHTTLEPAPRGVPSLFAFPAQSNFSGVTHPLELVALAHERGYQVLLDAAAFVPTHPLSLREVAADFVALSFYKIFGYPTGVGALIARREALANLRRPSFAGGAVDFVSIAAGTYRLSDGEAGFEDGTPNFLAIPAVVDGLDFIQGAGIDAIGAHVHGLTERLLSALLSLRHPGGAPAVRLYGPATMIARGGTIAFNLVDGRGGDIPHAAVVFAAARAGISLRGGCFCNPGAAEAAFGYDPGLLRGCLQQTWNDFSLDRLSDCLGGAPVGAIRASLGMASSREDVDRLLALLPSVCGLAAAPAPIAEFV